MLPAFSNGIVASAGFAGVNASVKGYQSAIAISVFYLSRQVGLIVGAAGGTGLARIGLARVWREKLGEREGSEEVSCGL